MEDKDKISHEFEVLLDEAIVTAQAVRSMFDTNTAEGRIKLLLCTTMLNRKVAADEGIPPFILDRMVHAPNGQGMGRSRPTSRSSSSSPRPASPLSGRCCSRP